MNESDDARSDRPDADDAVFEEVRAAAGAVVASLKQLIEATERVVADPDAFASAVDSGRSVVEAFVGGFTAQADADVVDDAEGRAEDDDEAASES